MTTANPARNETWIPLHGSARPLSEFTDASFVDGFVTSDWEGAAQRFINNFSLGELGGSFSVVAGGLRVVDVWGGQTAPEGSTWNADTLTIFFSCSKIISALVIHHLIANGQLDLDAPLSRVWPELRAGQRGGTLRMALSHTLGLPALERKLKQGAYNDHEYMAAQLEKQEPLWEPGTRVGYHPITYGFLLGELVRRVSGTTLGRYFKETLAKPLDLDLHIGLPEKDLTRFAPCRPYRPGREDPLKHVALASQRIGSIQHLWLYNAGLWGMEAINSSESLKAEIPAANGVGNSRSLAALLAIFLNHARLESLGFSQDTLPLLTSVSAASQKDATLLGSSRFANGLMMSIDNRSDPGADSFIMGRSGFGHVGMGGSFGFCDPEAGVSAAYVMNQQGHGILLNERGQGLIDATYRCAGFSAIRAGAWQP